MRLFIPSYFHSSVRPSRVTSRFGENRTLSSRFVPCTLQPRRRGRSMARPAGFAKMMLHLTGEMPLPGLRTSFIRTSDGHVFSRGRVSGRWRDLETEESVPRRRVVSLALAEIASRPTHRRRTPGRSCSAGRDASVGKSRHEYRGAIEAAR